MAARQYVLPVAWCSTRNLIFALHLGQIMPCPPATTILLCTTVVGLLYGAGGPTGLSGISFGGALAIAAGGALGGPGCQASCCE